MKRIILIVAVTAIAWAGFAFFGKQTGSEAHAHEEHEHEEEVDFDHIPLTAKQVSTVDLKMGEAVEREMDATIEAKGSLVLRAQAMGDVASLMGSAAKECELAKADLERQLLLSKQGAGVKRTLQQTKKDYQVAHANLLGIGRQLSQMGISTSAVSKGKFTTAFPLHAPISGIVSEMTASLGSYADMQTPLMKIRNTQAVECDLNVFEKDLSKIKVGNRVTINLTNQPGVKLSGTVYGMNQYFNNNSKAVAVHVRLDAASVKSYLHSSSGNTHGGKLFAGMYVSGKIATGSQQCLALPSHAIVSADGKQYVFALNGAPNKGNYSFSRHEVTTGASDGKYTEVKLCNHLLKGKNGAVGKKIVTENAYYLASLTGEHGEHAH